MCQEKPYAQNKLLGSCCGSFGSVCDEFADYSPLLLGNVWPDWLLKTLLIGVILGV
jgi:hypothetical protein